MNYIKVSIIIPVYKVSENYLRKCIESCVNQTLKEIEIILIDDGSPDNCGEICDEYALKDNRIKVIHKKNEGVSKARNVGVVKATGKYIGFVDADDWIETDFYEKMFYFGEKYGLEMIVSGFVKEKNNKILEVLKRENNKVFNKIEALKNLFERKLYVWSIWDKIYRSDTIKNGRIFFSERISMGEDLEFLWCLLKKINKIGYISLNKYHYCYRQKSVTSINSAEKKKDSVTVMHAILKESKLINKELFNIIKRVYLKEIASYCRLMLLQDEKKYRVEIKRYKREIEKLIDFGDFNFKLRIFLGILYWKLPYVICKNFKFLIR